MVGEGLDWVVTTLAGSIGAHILAIFLFVAGVLLLTGASVAGVIKATTDSVSTTTARAAYTRADAPPRPRARSWRRSSAPPACAIAERPQIEEPPEFDVWNDDPRPSSPSPRSHWARSGHPASQRGQTPPSRSTATPRPILRV